MFPKKGKTFHKKGETFKFFFCDGPRIQTKEGTDTGLPQKTQFCVIRSIRLPMRPVTSEDPVGDVSKCVRVEYVFNIVSVKVKTSPSVKERIESVR